MQKRKVKLVTSHYGDFYGFDQDLITHQLVKYGAHTRNEIAFLSSVVNKADRVIDLGAHIGTFAVPLAKAVGPNGVVVSVEADTHHFRLLSRNIKKNNIASMCVAIRALVASQDGAYYPTRREQNTGATFFLKRNHSTLSKNNSDIKSAMDHWPAQPPVISLDNIVATFFADNPVNIIKIDVEGMELSVLKSGAKTIALQNPVLYIEIAETSLKRVGDSISEIDQFLRNFGYRFFVNVGERNSSNDDYDPRELENLTEGGEFFDVLAIPADSDRIDRLF